MKTFNKRIKQLLLVCLLLFATTSYAQEKDYYSKGSTTVSFEPSPECDGRPVRFTIEWTLTSYLGEPAYNVKTKAEVFGTYAYYNGKRYNFELENSAMLTKIDPQLSDWSVKIVASLGDYDINLQENAGITGISIDGLSSKEISNMLKAGNKLHSFTISECIDFSMGDFVEELKKKQDLLKSKQKSVEQPINNTSATNTQSSSNKKSISQRTNSSFQPQAANLNKAKSVEYTNKANRFYNNGSYDEAEMYWQKALEYDPSNQNAKNNLASLKNIQNSNAQIMAQSQQRTNDFNSQQQNIQQSSKNIANNLANGSPNAVGQAGVATAKLLAESGAGYTESMLGGAGVVALGALLNSGDKKLGLTGENITKEYKNATYVGGFYDGKFDGNMEIHFRNGIYLKGQAISKYGYKASITIPNTGSGILSFYLRNLNLENWVGPKEYLFIQSAWGNAPMYTKSSFNYLNGDVYEGSFRDGLALLNLSFMSGKYKFKNGILFTIKSDLGGSKDIWKTDIYFPNGNKLEGKLDKMRRINKSTYTWNDKDKLTGKYDNGIRQGSFSLEFADGSQFKGKYQNNFEFSGTYINSNEEKSSINTNDLINIVNANISPKHLYKLRLIVFEDLINKNDLKNASVVYKILNKQFSVFNTSKYSFADELKFFLLENSPRTFLSLNPLDNLSSLYYNLNKGYILWSQGNKRVAVRHYYEASNLIKNLPPELFPVNTLRACLNKINSNYSGNYWGDKNFFLTDTNILSIVEKHSQVLNIINYTRELQNCKYLNSKYVPTFCNQYLTFYRGVTYQEYCSYLNENPDIKNKLKEDEIHIENGIIIPIYRFTVRKCKLSYKEYVAYMKWYNNTSPSKFEYKKCYPGYNPSL